MSSRKEKGPATTESLYSQYVRGCQAEGSPPDQILSEEEFYSKDISWQERRFLAKTSDPTFGSNKERSGCPKKGGGIKF